MTEHPNKLVLIAAATVGVLVFLYLLGSKTQSSAAAVSTAPVLSPGLATAASGSSLQQLIGSPVLSPAVSAPLSAANPPASTLQNLVTPTGSGLNVVKAAPTDNILGEQVVLVNQAAPIT